jgi:hypothetical protein
MEMVVDVFDFDDSVDLVERYLGRRILPTEMWKVWVDEHHRIHIVVQSVPDPVIGSSFRERITKKFLEVN